MADDLFHEVVTNQFRALFSLGAKDGADTVENVDAEVALPDGSRWNATFLTIGEIQKIMDRRRELGESACGAYFRCPDLAIIREAGVSAMVRAIAAAVADH